MTNGKTDNRNITNFASAVITLLMTAAFVLVWLLYYNRFAFRTHQMMGAAVSVLIWFVLYIVFAKTYRAFKIASCSIGEVAFSQFLSIGIADFTLYIACCLIYRQYVNILPGASTVVVQVLLALLWAFCAKQYFLRHVEPKDCLLICDTDIEEEMRTKEHELVNKLERAYAHLFRIENRISAGTNLEAVMDEISKYPIVLLYDLPLDKRNKIISYCVNISKSFYMTPTVEDVVSRGYDVKHFIDTPLFSYSGTIREEQDYVGKRLFDIIVSALMLIVLSPMMLITALVIKLEDGGDIFFRQARYTQGGRVFNILKFRSMVMDAEADGKPRPCVAGDSRITRVGKIIRATRIDEIPQLLNVLSGDMSLVGPRAERVEHVDLYTKELPEFQYRLRVKAGLTGYAQIYGKYNTSAKDKLLLDLLYIERQSFLMDLRIMFMTIKTVFTPESTEGFEESKSKAINQKTNSMQ